MEAQTLNARLGARIVALRQSLEAFRHETIVLDEYESVLIAGRAAALHSEIRQLGRVSATRYEQFRKIAELQRIQADYVLPILESNHFVIVERDAVGKVAFITALQTERSDSLEAAAAVFKASSPSNLAGAAISIVDTTYTAPIQKGAALQIACNSVKCSVEVAEQALNDLAQLKSIIVTDDRDGGDPLLANPQTFENDVDHVRLLSVFNSTNRDRALEVIDHIVRNPASPLRDDDREIAALLAEAGLLDYNAIQGHTGQIVFLPTLASIWGTSAEAPGYVGSDVVADSKSFLTTLRYGEFYSEYWRGQIMDQERLLSALIARGSVGPATAIGEDYPLVIARGIVNVVENPNFPGRFDMELRKKEIAEAVLEVVKGKTRRNARMPIEVVGLSVSESYLTPEAGRQRIELPPQFRDEKQAIVFNLLTIRRRNR